MPRTVSRQLQFWALKLGVEVEITCEALALTQAQVDEYRLPPSPGKVSDVRKSGVRGAVRGRRDRRAGRPGRNTSGGAGRHRAGSGGAVSGRGAFGAAVDGGPGDAAGGEPGVDGEGQADSGAAGGMDREVDEAARPVRERLRELADQLTETMAPFEERLEGAGRVAGGSRQRRDGRAARRQAGSRGRRGGHDRDAVQLPAALAGAARDVQGGKGGQGPEKSRRKPGAVLGRPKGSRNKPKPSG